MAKVSIVILSYNRKEELKDSLKKILSYGLKNLEIIVVDNASTDGTKEMIKNDFPLIKLIPVDKNIGVAAYNKGFKKASGDYILILDDDSYPDKGTIEKMIKTFEKDEKIGIIALDVRSEDYSGNKEKFSEEKTNKISYIMGFNGAGAGLRKSVFNEVGGYPDEFFLYWNEMDLSIRVLNAGYKIVWLPGAVVYHKFSPKNRESERGPFFYTRNLFWIILKYFPLNRLILSIIKMIYLCIYFSLEQRTLIYLKAMTNSIKNSKKAFKKRMKVKREIINKLKITYKLAFTIFR